MRLIPLAVQTLFADLEQRALDATFAEQFERPGTFKKMKRGKRFYWYWTYRTGPKVANKYVGPVTDKALSERVAKFEQLKGDFDQRRQIVRLLAAAGLPVADHLSGEITLALCRAGFFRLRGVLIGTTAYQCYSGVLGRLMPAATIRTQDADFAQFFAIANALDDTMPPMLETLRAVDPSFRPMPHIGSATASTAFVANNGYKVEFLTPNRGSDDYEGKPAPMPALGGASAEPLRFLDFLIRRPIRSVLLHEAGVPVAIPAPERYAIHKLIVAGRRHETSTKVDKDIAQASNLIQAMQTTRAVDLSDAWQEAWERGPAWRQELTDGVARLEETVAAGLEQAVRVGAARRRKPAPWPN